MGSGSEDEASCWLRDSNLRILETEWKMHVFS